MEYSDSFKEQVDRVIEKSLKEQHLQLLIVDYEIKRRSGHEVADVYFGICELCKELYGFSNVEPVKKYF